MASSGSSKPTTGRIKPAQSEWPSGGVTSKRKAAISRAGLVIVRVGLGNGCARDAEIPGAAIAVQRWMAMVKRTSIPG